jgi:glycosyltransferase involved in cell wall biosynthesis
MRSCGPAFPASQASLSRSVEISSMPEISVIMPTYNRAEYLPNAIASVLRQTFQDFEIIVVDDGSAVAYVPGIVERFADRRIRHLRHPVNRGLSAARNTGIRAARGRYIALLDDDDEWLPEKLALQYELLTHSPPRVGIVYTGCIYLDRATQRVYRRILPEKRGDLSKALLKYDRVVAGGSSTLLRRECFDTVGYFDEDIPAWEAYDLWIRLSSFYYFDYVKELLVKYYYQGNQINTDYGKLIKGVEAVLKKHQDYFSGDMRGYSSHYFTLGLLYYLGKNVQEGRRLMLKAVKNDPLRLRYYVYLLVSLLGLKNVIRITHIRDKLTTQLWNVSRLVNRGNS